MGDGERTLSRNAVNFFILRVDLVKSDILKIAPIAEKMAVNFDRSEKKQIKGFTVNFTQDSSEMLKEEIFDYVLISEGDALTLTFSEVQNAFWIQCNKYRDNSIYKNIISNIIEVIRVVFQKLNPNVLDCVI